MGPVTSVWPSSVDPDCPQPALGPARPATRAAVPVRGVMTLTVSLTDSGWWWWWWQAQLMPPSPDWVDDTPGGDTRRGQEGGRVGARHPRPAPPPATGAKYRERVRRGASRLQWQSHGQYEGCSPLGLYYSLLGCYRARRGKELIVYLWINWKHQHADWAQNWLGLCWTICTSSSSSESMSRPRDSSAALFCVFVSTFCWPGV